MPRLAARKGSHGPCAPAAAAATSPTTRACRTLLYEPDIEATNWPAEQAVRPLVVNRKAFGGNRTAAGGHAQEILGSIFATLAQRALDALPFLSHTICLPADQRPRFIQRLLPVPSN